MSNEIAKVRSPEDLPSDLAKQVRRIVHLGSDAMIDFFDDAAFWLKSRRELAAPGNRTQCHAWMTMLVQGINGVTETAAVGREAAIWAMCHDLPGFVWCQKTVNDAWAKTPFLPTPGEIREILTAHAAPLFREIAALEKIAAATPPPALQKAPPYEMPRAPDWVFDRKIQGPAERTLDIQPPQRTIEEQIAILKADAALKGE